MRIEPYNLQLMFFCPVSAMFDQRFSNRTSQSSVKMTGRYVVPGTDDVDDDDDGGGDFVSADSGRTHAHYYITAHRE